ncbi:MAG: glycosyltransferase [Cyanobacteria bacterium SZAS-4]|nr:glycosyltransferase [Cyanobacteria bacterium SZAS-4]
MLPFSIGSVLRQTFSDFEILVIGDGCTDDSQAVVQAVKDERVRWVDLQPNSGHQSTPNNEGLKQARGQLIAYLGHDDLWLPHHLQCLTREIANGSDLAHGITGKVSVDGNTIEPLPFPPTYERGLWIPPTGVVHKRELAEKLGGWRNYRELEVDPEVDLWLRAYDADYRLTFVPRVTALKFPAKYRRNAYKTRSSTEQSHWTKRIINEPDFEVAALMMMLMPMLEEKKLARKHILYKDLVQQFYSETCKRALARLPIANANSNSNKKGAVIDEARKYKGLG